MGHAQQLIVASPVGRPVLRKRDFVVAQSVDVEALQLLTQGRGVPSQYTPGLSSRRLLGWPGPTGDLEERTQRRRPVASLSSSSPEAAPIQLGARTARRLVVHDAPQRRRGVRGAGVARRDRFVRVVVRVGADKSARASNNRWRGSATPRPGRPHYCRAGSSSSSLTAALRGFGARAVASAAVALLFIGVVGRGEHVVRRLRYW